MKKIILALVAGIFAIALVACSQLQSASSTNESATQIKFHPNLQPKNHEGRWEAGGYERCMACHGANAQATDIPKSHFELDGTLSPERSQCYTCHPVALE